MTTMPWQSEQEINEVKENIVNITPIVKKHETHTAISERRLSLSIELKLLAYVLMFSLLVKSAEIIKSLI